MKMNMEIILILIICCNKFVQSQKTALDKYIPQFQAFRDAYFGLFIPPTKDLHNLRRAKNLNKLQPEISDDASFPCSLNNSRSSMRPYSVHALKPGDIEVIGALGDSLTAGNGLVATDAFQIGLQDRGISYAAGGQGSWRTYVTLPNIIKEFNPHLLGYALGDSFANHKEAELNVAEAFAMSRDMPFMAKELIRRIRKDNRIDIYNSWKMISLMIGSNDFCADMCYYKDPRSSIRNHRNELINTLRILKNNLPRTIVNLILPPDITILKKATLENRPSICYFVHNVLCPCIFGLQFAKYQSLFAELIQEWRQVEIEVANLPEFDTNEFTVTVQPFLLGYSFPKDKNGLTDYSSLSADCFHLVQKEGAKSATSLWNNLLEPVGNKSEVTSEVFNFRCPTEEHPYIYTRRNSNKTS